MNKVIVTIIDNNAEKTYEVDFGTSIKDFLRNEKINFAFPCAGRGVCNNCKIRIASPFLPTKREQKLLSSSEIESGIRFACDYRLLKSETLYLQNKSSEILTTFEKPKNVQSNFSFLGVEYKNKLLSFVDLGTTTVVVNVTNDSGIVLSTDSFMNPQSAYGADVIARIEYSTNGGLDALNSVIIKAIDKSLTSQIQSLNREPSDLKIIAVSGNTIMEHIFTKDSICQMGVYPYTPTYTEERLLPARELGLSLGDYAYVAPSISAFVGGDIVSGLVSIEKSVKYSLLVDLGTNGEIALFNNREVLSASTAIGPAFEGVGISCGMCALDGAITSVKLNPKKIDYLGVKPVGLCGSGLISLTSELVKEGIISESGYLAENYYLFDDVYLAPQDVRKIQLAKSAVCAGIKALLSIKKLSPSDIDKIYIAGGFGTYADTDDLFSIEMIDEAFRGKTVKIGNSSLSGITSIVLSNESHFEAINIGKSAKTVDLSTDKIFMEEFIENLAF